MDAQKIQDRIFRRMSADRKLELGAGLWKLGKLLTKAKSLYEIQRPTKTSGNRR